MGILFGVSRDKCKDNLLHESIESNETTESNETYGSDGTDSAVNRARVKKISSVCIS